MKKITDYFVSLDVLIHEYYENRKTFKTLDEAVEYCRKNINEKQVASICFFYEYYQNYETRTGKKYYSYSRASGLLEY